MPQLNFHLLIALCTFYQQVAYLFQSSTFNDSTLWVADRGQTWIPELQVQESSSEVTITATIPRLDTDHLEIRVSPETVFLKGVMASPEVCLNYMDFEFCLGRFQTLIPLPKVVDPQSTSAEISGDQLKIKMARAWTGRQSVKVPLVSVQNPADDLAVSA